MDLEFLDFLQGKMSDVERVLKCREVIRLFEVMNFTTDIKVAHSRIP